MSRRLFPLPAKAERVPRDLTQAIFGRLTAIEIVSKAADGSNVWRCICACGNEHFARATNLRTGKTKSCGCWSRDLSKQRLVTMLGRAPVTLERIARLEKIVEEQRLQLDALKELVEMQGRRAA